MQNKILSKLPESYKSWSKPALEIYEYKFFPLYFFKKDISFASKHFRLKQRALMRRVFSTRIRNGLAKFLCNESMQGKGKVFPIQA